MKAAVEVFNGRLTDKELPSKSLLAQKLEQVEDNAPHAEDMRDVTSVEDAESESYNALFDPSTNFLRIKPGRTTTTPPGTPEELRLRHRRIGLAWEMVRAKHCSCAWLPERCVGVDAYRRLSDHVLGSRVAWLRSGGGKNPSWTLVLKYEAEIRKQAYRLLRDSEAADLAETLSKASRCPETLTNFFVVPFSLEHKDDAVKERDASNGSGSLDARLVDAVLAKLGKGRGKGKEDHRQASAFYGWEAPLLRLQQGQTLHAQGLSLPTRVPVLFRAPLLCQVPGGEAVRRYSSRGRRVTSARGCAGTVSDIASSGGPILVSPTATAAATRSDPSRASACGRVAVGEKW